MSAKIPNESSAIEPSQQNLTYQVRPPDLVHSLGVVQFDVQVLVDALQGPADLDFVLKLDGDFVLDKRFKETVCSSANCVPEARK
jgi:hypothetical protein